MEILRCDGGDIQNSADADPGLRAVFLLSWYARRRGFSAHCAKIIQIVWATTEAPSKCVPGGGKHAGSVVYNLKYMECICCSVFVLFKAKNSYNKYSAIT